jgi:hypothetical protein
VFFIFSDSGIGMTKQELVDSLGTIASSGTAKFLKALKVLFDLTGYVVLCLRPSPKFLNIYGLLSPTGESRSWHGQQLDWSIWCWILFCVPCCREGTLLL